MPEFASDADFLRMALELSGKAAPSASAFSVGCVIVSQTGESTTSGYSREFGPQWHAEEVALRKALQGHQSWLKGATLYSSLEPCSLRKSGRRSCCDKIIDAGISRVVFALSEPSTFVAGHGAQILASAKITVVEIDDLAEEVRRVNGHLWH